MRPCGKTKRLRCNSVNQIAVLRALSSGDKTAKQMAEATGLSIDAFQAYASRLRRKGFVFSRPMAPSRTGSSGRPNSIYWITRSGENAVIEVLSRIAA